MLRLEADLFGDGEYFEIYTGKNKQDIRRHIEDNSLNNERMRIVGPGGIVTNNPVGIKLQKDGKHINPRAIVGMSRERYRLRDDLDPIIMPRDPIGRMRFLKRQTEAS